MNFQARTSSRLTRYSRKTQRGVVLFFAMICLLTIMLAAVALVRSVDTNTIIAGNLALQQSATRSSDAGTEAALVWLRGIDTANASRNVLTDANHPMNTTAAGQGYYANLDPALSLTATSGSRINWVDADSSPAVTDGSGNTTRYIIQRMCRLAGVEAANASCLFSGTPSEKGSKNIVLPQDVCKGGGCPTSGQTPQIRVTARTTGPRNTVSYVQTFVY